MRKTVLYRCREDRVAICNTCAHRCEIRPGEVGRCGVRSNIGGDIIAEYYGIISRYDVKKGVSIGITDDEDLWFMVGTVGCNFRCPSCRFVDFSYGNLIDYKDKGYVDPGRLIEDAKLRGLKNIAFGFNEPFVEIEYVLDVFSLAKREKFKTALLTNGFFTIEALNLVAPYVDRYVVYIKAFTSHSFKLYTGVSWKSNVVFENISYMLRNNYRVDVATILVPGVNDSVFEIRSLARWILYNMGSDAVWHIFPFKPTMNMYVYPPMSKEKLIKALDIAVSEGLNRIYLH